MLDVDVTVGPLRKQDTVTIGSMRTPTKVGNFKTPPIVVGKMRTVEKYKLGPMISKPPVTINTFRVPTKVSGFAKTWIDVHELHTESPVTVGVRPRGSFMAADSDIWITATEYRRNALTINNGTVADITAVGRGAADQPERCA